MAYDPELAQRVQAQLGRRTAFAELPMMGGLIFMVNDKMCVGVIKDQLMVRIDPQRRQELLAMPGCHPMSFKGRGSKGFVLVESSAIQGPAALAFWLEEGLSFNNRARSYGKKRAAKRGAHHPA